MNLTGEDWEAPGALPGGRGILFGRCSVIACEIWALDLRSGRPHRLLAGNDDGPVGSRTGPKWGQYVAGHIVYAQDDGVFAVPFDVDAMKLRGSPVALANGLDAAIVASSVSVSASGTLVMRPGDPAGAASYQMMWVDRAGREAPVDTAWAFNPSVSAGDAGWALSPDGARLAIGLVTATGEDIWVKELRPGGRLSRVTLDPGPEHRPRWTPDGRSVTFVAPGRTPPGLYQRRADGTGTDSLLFEGYVAEGVWHPGRDLLLLRWAATTLGPGSGGRDITGFRPGTDTAATPVLVTPFDESAIMLSPDGRWLAYQSDETGANEVFVRPFPITDSGGKYQASNGGGAAPLWSRNGRELFYLAADGAMMAVRVTAGDTLQLDQPVVLFRLPAEMRLLNLLTFRYTPWDVAPDGRFLLARRVDDVDADAVIVVENFLEELKAGVPR